MVKRIRLGFLGAGDWGQTKHLPSIAHIQAQHADTYDVRITALCEQDPDIAAKVMRTFAIPRLYPDLASFAQAPDIDAYVVVVNPRGLAPVIERLAQRGLPIFSEKPLGWSHAQARHLAQIAPSPNLVAYNRRYFPFTQRAREAIAELDGPYYVSCNICRHQRTDSADYRQGLPGAVPFVLGTAIHSLNLLEYLFGPIDACRPASPAPAATVDHWLADLTFVSGLAGRINILPCSGSSTEWIVVHSPTRSLYMRLGMYSPSDAPGSIEVHEAGQHIALVAGDSSLPPLVQQGFVGEYLDFFRAIRDGDSTRSTFQSSVNAMRIAEIIEPLDAEATTP